jgi:hypothetical protein
LKIGATETILLGFTKQFSQPTIPICHANGHDQRVLAVTMLSVIGANGRSWSNLVEGGRWLWVDSPVYQSAAGWRVTPLARFFLLSLEAKTDLKGRYSFRRSQISRPRARSRSMDDFAVPLAQFDLANVTAHSFCAR